MPVVPGRKSRIESFAGANVTYTIEAMMGDMKALQASECGRGVVRNCRGLMTAGAAATSVAASWPAPSRR